MALLYHLGVMQLLIRGVAWVMRRTMGTSGSESLSCAANIFVGQTEAPFVIKPYLATMTRSYYREDHTQLKSAAFALLLSATYN